MTVEKKIVLEGNFTYGFMGTAGQWYFRLNGEEIDPQITTALDRAGLVKNVEPGSVHPRYSAGKVRITIEPIED